MIHWPGGLVSTLVVLGNHRAQSVVRALPEGSAEPMFTNIRAQWSTRAKVTPLVGGLHARDPLGQGCYTCCQYPVTSGTACTMARSQSWGRTSVLGLPGHGDFGALPLPMHSRTERRSFAPGTTSVEGWHVERLSVRQGRWRSVCILRRGFGSV